MTATIARTPVARRPRIAVVTSAVLVALVVALGIAVVASTLDRTPSPITPKRVLEYESAVTDPITHGGQVVQLGLKEGVGDLGSEHKTAPAVIAEQARAWRLDLVDVRAHLVTVHPPSALRDAHTRFIAALDGYIASARFIEEAARADGSARERLLDRAAASGAAADRTFDRGSAVLQRVRRHLGMEPNPNFPGTG